MKLIKHCLLFIALASTTAITPSLALAQTAKYAPDVPAKITTPDTQETRIGTLRFKDGVPDAATEKLAYDQLDFGRGIDAFLQQVARTFVGWSTPKAWPP